MTSWDFPGEVDKSTRCSCQIFSGFKRRCYSAPDSGAEYCDERVCVCVCVSVRDHIFGTTRPIFTKIFLHVTMTVARSSSGGVVICCVLPVLWMTLFLLISTLPKTTLSPAVTETGSKPTIVKLKLSLFVIYS